jgi:hypothetical protein
MAVSKNELSQYHSDWLEVQGFSKYGYVLKVLEHLGMNDDPNGVNRRRIHNVYSGAVKDRQILDAIRSVCLPNSGTTEVKLDRKNVMAR